MINRLFFFLFFIYFSNSNAQVLCSGTFGSPIVNITFGSGNNPGGQLPAIVTGASTSYRYSAVTGSPPASVYDGEYSIINQGPANNGAWIAGYDHTGNTKGYMAFFNAADSIGEFYKQVITGINPNTVYEFAAWVTNVLKPGVVSNPSYPNITFEIRNNANNALLATYNTGNVPMSNTGSLVWKQYGFLFSTPQNISSIKLLLINNNAGGLALPGNDLAIDDITFRECRCNSAAISAGNDLNICKDDTVQLNVSGVAGMTKFAWSPKSDLSNDTIVNPKAFPSKDTKYIVTVSKSSCSYSDTIEIKVDSIYADAGVDTNICEGQLFKLYGKSNSTLSWSPGVDLSDSTISNPFATPKISSKYILTAKGPSGCIKRDTVNVNVVNISVNAGLDKSICLGDSIQLNGNGSGVLTWNTSNSLSNNMLPNPFAKPINTTEYILTVNQNNCSRSDTVKVIVSKIIVDAGSNQTICNPDSIQLIASGGKNYFWSPGAITNDSTSQSPKAFVSQTTKFILMATDSIGCMGQDSTTIYLATKAVSISSMDTSICKGEIASISVVGSGYYLWSTSQTDSIISVSPTQDTKYWVVSSPPGMCASDTSYTNVRVFELPIASFNVNVEIGLKPLNVNFSNTSSNFSDFVWKFGDGETSKLSNVNHTYNDVGTYIAKLIAVNGNGCYDSTIKTIIVFDSFLVFIPNTFSPNNDNKNDVLNIHYDNSNVKEGYVSIYNRWGEKIYSSNLLNYIPWDGTYRGKPVQIDVYLLVFEVTNKQNEQYIRHELINVLK